MIRVLFFGKLRERLHCSELNLAIEQPLNLNELCECITQQGGKWSQWMQGNKPLAAINQTMVSFDSQVKPGDEVAFFPPVTGG